MFPMLAHADLWSGVLSADRGIPWSAVGANPTEMNKIRTQCGATIAAYSGTTATIQNAITACGTDQYVHLGTGTFTLSGVGLTMPVTFGVVLRGDGADKTILKFTGGGAANCPIAGTTICVVRGSGLYPAAPEHIVDWTAGYSKGATVVTLASVTQLPVGGLLGLDQLDDAPQAMTTPDNGNLWFCWSGFQANPICSAETTTPYRYHRNNVQIVKVTAVNGNDVTISPGIYMPNFGPNNATKRPQAFYMNARAGIAGVENVTIDVSNFGSGATNTYTVLFSNCSDCWLTGSRIIRIAQNGVRCMVCGLGAQRITVKDNYLYAKVVNAGSQAYGTEFDFSSDILFQNNITDGIDIPLQAGQGEAGAVWGYNYSVNDVYTLAPAWMQASSYRHAIGNTYHLDEGNDGIGFTADAIHGPSFFTTGLRNRWRGFDPEGGSSGGKTLQTIAVQTYAYNRYFSYIGNVLGEPGLHTNYEGYPASASTGGDATALNVSIYQSGWSGNQQRNQTEPTSSGIDNDVRVRQTLMRFGNYDVVTGLPRYCGNSSNTRWATAAPIGCASTSEVPTGDAYYPNTVPASETIPNSFYLSAKPVWFGNVTWPPIGPDVTGGTVTAGSGGESTLDGHVYKIPARLCYESMITDTAYVGAAVKVFNAAACLNATPPAVPTFGNLGIGTLTFNSTSAVPLWSKFTAPSLNGRTISKLTAYLRDQSGGSFTLGGAIYAGNGTIPTTKLCEDTGNVTVTGSAPAWYEIPISCAFTTGQELWLAIWGNTINLVYNYESTGGSLNYKTGSTFETWPDPNAQSNLAPWAVSIYATYNSIASELEPPSDMVNLAAGTPTTTTIPLTWNAGSDAQGAITSSCEICAGSGCTNFATYATGLSSPATLTGLTPATLYRDRCWHVDTDHNVSVNKSSIVEATTATEPTLTAPAKPTGLIISQSTNASVTLVWAPNAESDLAGYKIYSGPNSEQVGALVATRTPASAASTHSPLTTYTARVPVGQVIWFSVTAYDTDGNESSGATSVGSNLAGITARAARQ